MMRSELVDAIDAKILRILLDDARASKAEIGRQVQLTPTAVHERIRKLEAQGVIAGYTVRLDPRALGRPILAFVFISDVSPAARRETGRELSRVPGVEEVHAITGSRDFLIKVRVAETESLARVLESLGSSSAAAATDTAIVLDTFLERPFSPPTDDDG